MCNRLLSHLHCFLLMPALIFQVSSILTLGLIMLKKLLDVEIQVFYGCEDCIQALTKIDVTECSAANSPMGMLLARDPTYICAGDYGCMGLHGVWQHARCAA